MLQKLLADRFKLSVHRDTKSISAYALNVAKSGLKMDPAGQGEGRVPGCRRNLYGTIGVTTAVCQSLTSGQLAQQLQTLAPAYFRDSPVVDHTGLTKTTKLPPSNGSHSEPSWMLASRDPVCLDAVSKLGLTLDRQKDSVEVLAVDHCEKTPTEN